jgi:hypothetical protein
VLESGRMMLEGSRHDMLENELIRKAYMGL